MLAVSPALISEIDAFAATSAGIPAHVLMRRAGDAVAALARTMLPARGTALILCGSGNNGGDGYAAAVRLARDGYRALCVDVMGAGQRSEAGRCMLAQYRSEVGEPLSLADAGVQSADLLVDAVLGTGAHLPLDARLLPVARFLNSRSERKLAIDLPLGVDAEDGRVAEEAVAVDTTLCLGFYKHGLFSYPAREYAGNILLDDIGLATEQVLARFAIPHTLMDVSDLAALAPHRAANTHKGSFGELLLLVGSPEYRGAATLAAAAALRMGAGRVTLAAEDTVTTAAIATLPELITRPLPKDVGELALRRGALLLGCGSRPDGALFSILSHLLTTEGGPVVLDASALTCLAEAGDEGRALLRAPRRQVVLTPHPGEMARLLSVSARDIQADRLGTARRFAAEYPVTLVLKGAGTVVAEGERFSVNLTGGPALAKAGSGDVLAGALGSLLACGLPPYDAARLAVCLHGLAGDRLAARLSPLGVRAMDLPLELAAILAEVSA